MAGKRDDGEGSARGSGGHAGVRLLSALLTEMDGMELATGTTPPNSTHTLNTAPNLNLVASLYTVSTAGNNSVHCVSAATTAVTMVLRKLLVG